MLWLPFDNVLLSYLYDGRIIAVEHDLFAFPLSTPGGACNHDSVELSPCDGKAELCWCPGGSEPFAGPICTVAEIGGVSVQLHVWGK